MAPGDLDHRKADLETKIDYWESRAIGFTWPVAVGLLIEFYAVLSFAYTRDWNSYIDRIGLFLVTVGVAGELAAASKSHAEERNLRVVNTHIERVAEERIAALNLKSEQEQLARAKIEETNARLQLEILNLRTKLADRMLTQAEQDDMVKVLRTVGGMYADVVVYEGTYEVVRTASLIAELARKAGWRINQWKAEGTGAARGILVAAIARDDFPKADLAAILLVQFLHSRQWASLQVPYNYVLPPGTKMRQTSGDETHVGCAAPVVVLVGEKP